MKLFRLCVIGGLAILLTALFFTRTGVAQELSLDSELGLLNDGSSPGFTQSYQPGQPLPPGVEPPPYYRYRSGDPLPKGYHVEDRATKGLLIAGYIVTGIPYVAGLVIALAAGLDNQSGWLLLPVAGPWVTLGERRRACDEIGDSGWDSAYCVGDRISEWLLGIDGVIQGIGAGLVVLGLVITKPYAVRDEVPYVVTPSVVGSGYGLKAYGWW